jgi:hypothetical protein
MDMKRHMFISFLIFMLVDKGKKKWNNYLKMWKFIINKN